MALHLLRLRSQTDLARRVAADRLRDLLSGNVAEAEVWLPPPPWRVVVLAGDPDLDPESQLLAWESAFRRARWRSPLLALLDDVVVTLVRDGDLDESQSRADAGTWSWLRAAVDELVRTRPAVRASAGSAVRHLPQLARSRQEALEVQRLALAGRLSESAVSVEDAWAEVTCERAVSGIRAARSPGPVTDLHTHDEEHGTAYAATLAAWLDHPGDPRTAATSLHVHPNTLRYRMQKLPEIVDLDLTDPVTRLATRLELRALGH